MFFPCFSMERTREPTVDRSSFPLHFVGQKTIRLLRRSSTSEFVFNVCKAICLWRMRAQVEISLLGRSLMLDNLPYCLRIQQVTLLRFFHKIEFTLWHSQACIASKYKNVGRKPCRALQDSIREHLIWGSKTNAQTFSKL